MGIEATVAPLTGRDAYALWIAGAALLCLTLFQLSRAASGPRMQLPRPTRAQMGTILAWLIIAVIVVYAMTQRR
jgi:hypothetical protein